MRALPVPVASVRQQRRARAVAWIAVAALLFCAATTLTIAACASMSSKGGMPMPGGWTMSMAWARMCGQTWRGAAASFLGMWSAMTVAMMLPALMPALWRCRAAAARAAAAQAEWFAVRVGAGYFAVWIALGVVVYPLGVALAMLEMRCPMLARAVPFATGVVVLLAGAFQLSASKARYLACCRAAAPRDFAWREGVRLGWHCIGCCAGITAMVLVIGVMDLRVMAFAAAAITGERLARNGERVARIVGFVVMAVGAAVLAQASGIA